MMARKNTLLALGVWLFLIAPSKSPAQEGFYSLEKESLDFRITAKATEDGKPQDDWEGILDLEGNRFLISKNSELSPEDVEGVMIKKMPAGGVGEYYIQVYFRKESWGKVRDRTGELVGKRLGVVRRGGIFIAPIVMTPIDKQASLDVPGKSEKEDQKVIQWFIEGFAQKEEPSNEKREQEYFEWLEQRVKKSPDDLGALSKLAGEYLFRGLSGEENYYNRAVALYEKVQQKDPSRTDNLLHLASAYRGLGAHEKAIETYTRALQAQPRNEWSIRLSLAEVYRARGENDRALQELEHGLKWLKPMTILQKAEKIRLLEGRIEKIKKDTK